MKGASRSTCLSNMRWSGREPECEGNSVPLPESNSYLTLSVL